MTTPTGKAPQVSAPLGDIQEAQDKWATKRVNDYLKGTPQVSARPERVEFHHMDFHGACHFILTLESFCDTLEANLKEATSEADYRHLMRHEIADAEIEKLTAQRDTQAARIEELEAIVEEQRERIQSDDCDGAMLALQETQAQKQALASRVAELEGALEEAIKLAEDETVQQWADANRWKAALRSRT